MKDYNIGKLLRYLLPYRKQIAVVITATLACNIISILILYQFKAIIDRYVPERELQSVGWVALGILCLLLVQFVLNRLTIRLLNLLMAEVPYRIRNDVFDYTQRLKYEWFTRAKIGDMNTQIIQDVESLSASLFQRLAGSLTHAIYFAVTFGALLTVQARLTFLIALFMGIFSFAILGLKKSMTKHAEAYAAARSELNNSIHDTVHCAELAEQFGMQDFFLKRLTEVNRSCNRKWLMNNIYFPGIQSSMELATLVTYLIVFVAGARLIHNGAMTMGGLALFISYLPQLWNKYGSVIDLYNGYISLKVYCTRVFQLFTLGLEEEAGAIQPVSGQGLTAPSLVADGIQFSFVPGRQVLQNVSFKVERPGLYAIKGESGCGKSTLFELLLGFYKVQDGKLIIHGVEAGRLSLEELRRLIGIVYQDVFLLHDTILSNIQYGDPSITEDKIMEAARGIGMDRYLDQLEAGLHTIIGHPSSRLSNGQKRMISILRTLCRNPDILLLDEVTASLDSYSEKLIHQAIREISKEKIVLWITHKEYELELADEIIEIQEKERLYHDRLYESAVLPEAGAVSAARQG